MRLMVAGGGTGGHIYPALALIEQLQRVEPETEVLYVGTTRGLENQIVPKAGIELRTMEMQGFKRSLSLDNFKTIYLFMKSVSTAKKWLKEFKPDVVLGTGGYVSGAVLYAAAKLGIPTVIHEQNSVVGVTNKFLSKYVDEIAISFEAARSQFPSDKVTLTGNPRAQQFLNAAGDEFSWTQVGLRDDVPTVMIFGGSQGAPKINQSVLMALPELNQRHYQVVFATGQKRYDAFMEQLAGQPIADHVKIVPYIDNMQTKLSHVQALVSRAGATTIAEVTALGLPTIMIPSPYVTANHQVKNAQALVDAGAAEMILESDLSGTSLLEAIDTLMLDERTQRQMAGKAEKLGHPHAADDLIAVMKQAIAKHQKSRG